MKTDDQEVPNSYNFIVLDSLSQARKREENMAYRIKVGRFSQS